MAAVQTRGIEGGTAYAAAPPQMPADGGAEQPTRSAAAQQALAGLVQGGEVGHTAQADGPTQVLAIVQQGSDAAVVGLEEGLEDQADEQLRLRVQLGAALWA